MKSSLMRARLDRNEMAEFWMASTLVKPRWMYVVGELSTAALSLSYCPGDYFR